MINLWRQDPHNKYGKELFDNVPSDFTKTDNRASHHTSFTQIIMTNIISMNLPVKNVNKRDSKKRRIGRQNKNDMYNKERKGRPINKKYRPSSS